MSGIADLRAGAPWRLAVWGLRVMGPGLVAVIGLIAMLSSKTAGQVLSAVGILIYLVGVVVTVTAIVWMYRSAEPPRPGFLDVRWVLLRDALHMRR